MTYAPYLVPISVKGIVFENGQVWLRKNERKEWELPGGKLDEGEQPDQTITRELLEELGFKTELVSIINAHMYTIQKSIDETRGVLVVSYLCKLIDKVGDFEYEGEAGKAEFRSFEVSELVNLNMPSFYKQDIYDAHSLLSF